LNIDYNTVKEVRLEKKYGKSSKNKWRVHFL
jgi:hypothetical protein